MEKKILIALMMSMLVLPMINADLIMPGYKVIPEKAYIKNINDFPDYIFISRGMGIPSMCGFSLVKEDGTIPGVYNFCTIDVYAIERSVFNDNLVNELTRLQSDEERDNYLESLNAIIVLREVSSGSVQVPETSSQKEIIHDYEISIEGVNESTKKTTVKRNNGYYLYFIIPLVALIIILFIIFRRKK